MSPDSHLAIYVSGHGYGHSTRAAEALRAVRERAPGLPITVGTSAPAFLFEGVVPPPLAVRHVECDVGLVQKDALVIDEEGTVAAWRRFMAGWDALPAREAAWLRSGAARLVVADIPPVAFAAAAEAGLPSIGISNFLGLDLRPPRLPAAGPGRVRTTRAVHSSTSLLGRPIPGVCQPRRALDWLAGPSREDAGWPRSG